jgi:hypothetical protein
LNNFSARTGQRKPRLRRLRALAVGLLLTIAVTAAVVGTTAEPASASAACWDRGCIGLDPQATGCSASGYTVATAVFQGDPYHAAHYVDLRYSDACGANWARGRAISGPVSMFVIVQVQSDWTLDQPGSGTGYTIWSPMTTGASNLNQACANQGQGCTGWF